MKLATRMTLAIGCAALLLFGGSGLAQLRREERDLRAVAVKETLLLARSLQTAFENALRDRQIEDVTETLGALAKVDPSVAIFVFDEKGKLVGISEGAHVSGDTLRIETRARGRAEPIVEFGTEGDLLRLGLRLREETPASASAIVLEKPLGELQRDLRVTRLNVAVTSGVFVLAVAGIAWILARRYVGIPLGRLVENMKKVRSGDMKIAHVERGDDEAGQTQAEFERLVVDLDAAHERADQEFDARRRMELALQNADKLVTLGQLSAVMAHEIGSPLQVLEGRARALHRHASDPEATKRTAEMLVEQTERITKIVEQMLSITRRRAPARSSVDAAVSLRSVVALLELEAKRKEVLLVVETDGKTDVFADPDQLQQVVLNLARNALDASPRGGRVGLRLGGDAGSLALDVVDEGPGVPEEVRPHLFEAFFTTKTHSGGSGLGLSVVRSIVQEHGGSVEFAETGGAGCRVSVRLPRGPHTRAA